MQPKEYKNHLRAERLETRHLLSGVGFAGHDIDVSEFVTTSAPAIPLSMKEIGTETESSIRPIWFWH